ncbi:hypothetical protein EU546_07075 [Candidatus Thorarchaeota archaeon]|nr:MAG: hypothetical protein EU546_07075 [Candidatus Thorarchaeota archaeon]
MNGARQGSTALPERFQPKGLVHVIGLAGSGKTAFASRLAVDASSNGRVEWICNDGKSSVLRYLRSTAQVCTGTHESIYVTFTREPSEAMAVIVSLSKRLNDEVSLVVIDPITRTLDLANVDSPMWGRELIEEIMPVLASLANNKGTPILLTSECRYVPDLGVIPIHHETIQKWIDREILLKRSYGETETSIQELTPSGNLGTIGKLWLTESGAVELRSNSSIIDAREAADPVW